MKAMRNPFRGASKIWRDTNEDVYVMVYPTCVKGVWNWGINPGLVVYLWKFSAKKVFVDLVPPDVRRDLPYKPGAIPRGELMQRLSKNGEFSDQLGFFRLWVEEENL